MSLLCRLKNLVHKGILKEKDLERIIIIPERNDSEELVEMLTLLKNQAKDAVCEINRHDTLVTDIKLDSFNFVMDSAIKFIQKSIEDKK